MLNIPLAIRNARIAAGLTQPELAAKVSESQQYIAKIENGQRIPNLVTAMLIAQACGVTLAELVGEEEKE